MILIDFSQIVFSNFHQHMSNVKVMDEDLLRHMIINSVRGYNKKYRQKYGDMVIATDSRNYWRKDFFPHYKYSRKKSREADTDTDWEAFFKLFEEIKTEMREAFPYKFIEVDGAEGDDIIGTLVLKYWIHEPIMIISSDHDFKQFHKYKGVEQYSPMQKKKVVAKNVKSELKEKIIRGDKGDGIPNIFSPDDIFFKDDGTKQCRIYQKKLDIWLNQELSQFLSEEEIKRFHQNETLIDLEKTPSNIANAISDAYEMPIRGSKMKLLTYLSNNRMRLLIDCIEDF